METTTTVVTRLTVAAAEGRMRRGKGRAERAAAWLGEVVEIHEVARGAVVMGMEAFRAAKGLEAKRGLAVGIRAELAALGPAVAVALTKFEEACAEYGTRGMAYVAELTAYKTTKGAEEPTEEEATA